MELVTYAQMRRLLEASAPPCVSIFMPTHTAGRDTRQDPALLKNLLREAKEKLVAKGMRATEAEDLLEPARKLLDDFEYWQHSDHGLAIYIAPNFYRGYRVPIELEATCHVNDRFDIKPLLPLLEGKLFYIVAVSLNDARLIECTPFSCRTIPLPNDVALSKEDAIAGEDEHRETVNRHNARYPMGDGSAGSLKGQAIDIQVKEQEDNAFFYRQLDEGIRRTMADPEACVVLAGVDSTVPHFRQETKIKHLADEFIPGNPEHVENDQLHAKARAILQPRWHQELNDLQEHFGNAMGKNLASHEIVEILPAAAQGRVGILFVTPKATYYGKFDNEKLVVRPTGADEPGAEDLVDRAAVQALMTGAQIVVVEPDQVPGNREVGAIFRY